MTLAPVHTKTVVIKGTGAQRWPRYAKRNLGQQLSIIAKLGGRVIKKWANEKRKNAGDASHKIEAVIDDS